MGRMKYVKTFVDVIVRMRTDATYIPEKVIWDGVEYKIEKILSITPKSPEYVGSGPTIKYTVIMFGQTKELYLEDSPRRWFIEKQVVQF